MVQKNSKLIFSDSEAQFAAFIVFYSLIPAFIFKA